MKRMIAVLLLLTQLGLTHATPQPTPQYEYKVEKCSLLKSTPERQTVILNQLHQDGWELICVTIDSVGGFLLYLKRSVQ